ncbi:dipeptidase PepV [Neobacillus jeddahensis]|uniref:dipeptidase PepV n=1 Tax=Neobacillus jeddahensis TaxID=1461580 RepID=UPI0005908102|nr:dipeptidase PepV [Neobacillus jeddahensis]
MDWKKEINSQKEALLNDLVDLLKIPSVKDLSTSSEQAPMGKAIKQALNLMLSKSERDGFRTKNIDHYVGFAELGPEDASHYIAILCHLDVVPATGEWAHDPFTPFLQDGKLYARGAIDDKGPTMAAYYALKILKENNLPLKHRVRIIFGTDEESGMSCMKKYVQTEPDPLTGFAPDAEFPIIHAEKGQINAILKWKQTGILNAEGNRLISFISGEKGNMVPDTATAKITGNQLDGVKEEFRTFAANENLEHSIEEYDSMMVLTLKGKSAHGMEPFKGINAGLKLADFIVTRSIVNHPYLQFISERLAEDFFGKKLNIAFHDEITGPLTVNAGIFRHVPNEEAIITLNIRCPVETPYLRTIEKLSEVVQEYGFEIEAVREKKPHHVAKNHPVIKVLQQAYEEESQRPAELLTTGGATYARFLNNGVAYGAVFPGKENTAHQKNEYVEIEDLYRAAAIYANAIYHLANLDINE